MSGQEKAPSWVIDAHIPSVARMYDYYLGGKDNFAADREAAERVLAVMPYVRTFTRDNRDLLRRVVTMLARQGIRQFLDLGSGLPTQENVHEVAHRVAPDSHVVYVDNDPIVLVHARALLATDPRTTVLEGDLRDPEAILASPALRGQIDLDRPVAVLLFAILHFIRDDKEVAEIVATLRERLAPGSYLAISHGYAGKISREVASQVRGAYADTPAGDLVPRTPEHLRSYFEGMELLEPGIVPVEAWRPEFPVQPDFDKAGFLAAVGRKR
jgi:hypothetical protein